MVINSEECVDEGLLSLLLVIPSIDFWFESDLTKQCQCEEDTDDAAVDHQRRDRVKRRIGCDDKR